MIRKGEVPEWLRLTFMALLGIYAIYVSWQISVVMGGGAPDLMLLSGGLLCLTGLALALPARRRLQESLEQLRDGGALVGDGPKVRQIAPAIEAEAQRWARVGAATVAAAEALVIVGGFFMVPLLAPIKAPGVDLLQFVLLLVAATLAAAVVGWYLGTFAVYGSFQRQVEAMGCQIWVSPKAKDGMGGLAPLVSLFRRQAILTLAPTAWIALCLSVMAPVPWLLEQYRFWRFPLLLLLMLAIFYAILGFYRPALQLERTLLAEEHRLIQQANSGGLDALRNARRRITPRASTFLIALALLVAAMVLTGLFLPSVAGRGQLSVFLFGP